MGPYSLRDLLEEKTKPDLVKMMKAAGLKYSNRNKLEILDQLEAYLADEKNIEDIWKSLHPFERDYVEEYFKYNEKPSYEILSKIIAKYGLERGFFYKPWSDQSSMNLLFFHSVVPSVVEKHIKKYLAPLEINYETLEEPPLSEKSILNTIGESFAEDFTRVLHLAKIGRLKLTKAKKQPTKKTVQKINEIIPNKEYLLGASGAYGRDLGVENIGNFNGASRIYSIYMLLLESLLLFAPRDKCEVTPLADSFIKESIERKCKRLFAGYLTSNAIFELSRIPESDYRVEKKGSMENCRRFIMEQLKKCPAGKWIDATQFVDSLRQIDKNFLLKEVGSIEHYSEKHRGYFEPWVEWVDVEGRFIEVVLQEYLSVLGIVDTVIVESAGGCWDYDELPFFKVEYFRITPLGAFVLGITDEYHSESYSEEKPGFTVLGDNKVKVRNTAENQLHHLFFGDFARKEKSSQHTVYNLTFNAIAKALDKGVTALDILNYMDEHSCNKLPHQMRAKIRYWDERLHQTTIENITIVKTKNRELLEAMREDPEIKKYIALIKY